MKPHCYDRPAFKHGFWARDGYRGLKPKWRWVPFRLTAECMAWAAPEGCKSGPETMGWNCRGCRHEPTREG